jgi:hypothetical protein
MELNISDQVKITARISITLFLSCRSYELSAATFEDILKNLKYIVLF